MVDDTKITISIDEEYCVLELVTNLFYVSFIQKKGLEAIFKADQVQQITKSVAECSE